MHPTVNPKKSILALVLTLALLCNFMPGSADSLGLSISRKSFDAGDMIVIGIDAPKKGVATLEVYDAQGIKRASIDSELEVAKGYNELFWDGTYFGNALPSGEYSIRLTLNNEVIAVKVTISSDAPPFEETEETEPEESEQSPDDSTETESTSTGTVSIVSGDILNPTPALRSSSHADHDADGCYWCTPMDITDEEAVWSMLTAPMWVVDVGLREQVIIRAEPSDSSEGIGVVTGTSQGVHLLENLSNGWSLIECYSSSFHDSKVKNWNAFVTGYIRTDKLVKRTPNQKYGLVIDKLTQRLYIFEDGHLKSELLVSTGLYNSRQPYNETRSGEFMLVSKTGDFKSDSLICAMAIRFNSGDLLHEVPHVKNADGTKNYKTTEYKLGTRASHGCIRVQRLKNPDGINMTWLYNNLVVDSKSGTKLVIWEDFQGRQITIPDDSTPVYYNPDGGSYYHSCANCNSVKDKFLPLTEITYGELETGAYAKLTACPYCIPEKKKSELEKINLEHQTSSPGMVADYHQ